MQRGSLIIYDNLGKIWLDTGDAEGDILPHVYPDGLPYIETVYGELDNKIAKSVDVTVTPHKLVTEDIEVKPSYEDLENQLLLAENEKVEGGIF